MFKWQKHSRLGSNDIHVVEKYSLVVGEIYHAEACLYESFRGEEGGWSVEIAVAGRRVLRMACGGVTRENAMGWAENRIKNSIRQLMIVHDEACVTPVDRLIVDTEGNPVT